MQPNALRLIGACIYASLYSFSLRSPADALGLRTQKHMCEEKLSIINY